MKRQRATLPKDFDTQLIKFHADHNKRSAMEEITKVDPKLHYLRFSGHFDYPWLQEKIGKMKINDKPPKIMPNYRKEAYKKFEGGYLTVFFSPKEPFLPPCMIQTTASTKEFLIKIDQLLPGLKLSMVEYAVDIFCRDFLGTELLFWILRKHVYVPYGNRSMLYGGQEVDEGRMSFVCRITPVKLYERGIDEDKKDIPGTGEKGWLYKKVNRIRLEYTAEGYILKQKRLNTLKDLIRLPKFRTIFSGKIKFKHFRDTAGRFPRYWEGYLAKDLNGNSGAFQDEYVKASNSGVINLSQYLQDEVTLNQLNDMIQAEIAKFDLEWSNPPD
jgi:hypothetical protein